MLAGLMIVATANELILLFVGLELVSIPTYVLLYVGRHDCRGQEAASKYFFLSILSSAVLLYGFSFLYGAGGSTRLEKIATAVLKAIRAVTIQLRLLAPLCHAADFCRTGVPPDGRPVSFLCRRRLPGHQQRQCRVAFHAAENCRPGGIWPEFCWPPCPAGKRWAGKLYWWFRC